MRTEMEVVMKNAHIFTVICDTMATLIKCSPDVSYPWLRRSSASHNKYKTKHRLLRLLSERTILVCTVLSITIYIERQWKNLISVFISKIPWLGHCHFFVNFIYGFAFVILYQFIQTILLLTYVWIYQLERRGMMFYLYQMLLHSFY